MLTVFYICVIRALLILTLLFTGEIGPPEESSGTGGWAQGTQVHFKINYFHIVPHHFYCSNYTLQQLWSVINKTKQKFWPIHCALAQFVRTALQVHFHFFMMGLAELWGCLVPRSSLEFCFSVTFSSVVFIYICSVTMKCPEGQSVFLTLSLTALLIS